MKEYKGFASLLDNIDRLPDVGWLFVDSTMDRASKDSVKSAVFYTAEDDAEEVFFENSKRVFVECPTMLDIKRVVDKRASTADLETYLEAVLYYLINDDFKEFNT
ncbi:hypothetical protein HKK52_00140 [Pseudomonas sp. ADAK2]|uniref:hypothetical protein n=1 Tax=unclassified Pseudomonas TaxID=196821 RepID=UPI0014641670|nr:MULTISPECIES: hypothetical protein [unclassified Pseudomonas]QJI39410.1 hypothetical protein HKK53_00140 [Pseudomonas sp. ADAK7]QJI45716.1 hypothetical protein HKK52_00140 [Pseudomonas sp. ADAK2]